MSKLELLNQLLEKMDGEELLEGHRYKNLLKGIHKSGYHHGLQWQENEAGDFILKTCMKADHLDYMRNIKDKFPEEMKSFLSSRSDDSSYTLFFCKKEIPEDILDRLVNTALRPR